MHETSILYHSCHANVRQEVQQARDMPEVFWGPKEHQVTVCIQKEIGAVFQNLIKRVKYTDIAFQVHNLLQYITMEGQEGVDLQHNMTMDQIWTILERDLLNSPRNELGNRHVS